MLFRSVDASVALAWGFPDENSDYADIVLEKLEGKILIVPVHWAIEIGNALIVGERRKRLLQTQTQRFLTLLNGLTIVQDIQIPMSMLNQLLPLTRQYNLSAYDTAYLELAIRENAPFTTLDEKLKQAAKKAGLTIFEEIKR